MAGINLEGAGRKKALDSEINMIPMIDLLMVTVSFLLITAVWSTMGRVEANAQVPGDPNSPTTPTVPEPRVHVEIRDESHFVVSLRIGETTLESHDLEDHAVSVGKVDMQYQGLAKDLESESRSAAFTSAHGTNVVVLHTGNDVRFEEIVRVMDAILSVKRPENKDTAFRVSFASR